jgi:hypothetical protein
MNIDDLPSDDLAFLRDLFTASALEGHEVRFNRTSTCRLAVLLTGLVKDCRALEEEVRVLEHRLRARGDDLRNRKASAAAADDKIVAFPVIARPVPPEGGAA